jgi:hypothetical protein
MKCIGDMTAGQEEGLAHRLRRRPRPFVLEHFADLAMIILHGIGGIDQPPKSGGELNAGGLVQDGVDRPRLSGRETTYNRP